MNKIKSAIKSFLLFLIAAVCTILSFIFLISVFIMPEDRLLMFFLMTIFLIIDVLCFIKLVKTLNKKTTALFISQKEKQPPQIAKKTIQQKTSSRNTPQKQEPQQYIIHNNTIEKVGGEITQADVPYLIELGYQDALRQEANSSNPKFHRTDREEELAFNFFQKYEEQISRLECSFEYPYREEQKTYNYQDKITLLELALNNFDKAKKWCYSKGKGGQIHFDDMWMNLHNSQTECFSYANQIQNRLDFIKTLMVIRQQILDIVNQTPGMLQKDIYKFFDEEQKSDVVYAIKDLVKDDCILKEKKGNSYSLTALVSQDVRNRN